MESEMETATEFALEFVMKISTEVEQLVAMRLAQEIKCRDDAVRQECAERAIAYISELAKEKDLGPEIDNLFGAKGAKGLLHAIIDRYQH